MQHKIYNKRSHSDRDHCQTRMDTKTGEYEQDMPQSKIKDQTTTHRGSDTRHSNPHDTKNAINKAISVPILNEIIAKPERTQASEYEQDMPQSKIKRPNHDTPRKRHKTQTTI